MAAFITLKMLEEKNVYWELHDWFKDHFGDSVEVTIESMLSIAHVFDNRAWLWLSYHFLSAPAWEAYYTEYRVLKETYKAATASATASYNAVLCREWAAFALVEETEKDDSALAAAVEAYNAAIKQPWADFQEAKAIAFAKAFINQNGI